MTDRDLHILEERLAEVERLCQKQADEMHSLHNRIAHFEDWVRRNFQTLWDLIRFGRAWH